MEKSSGEGLPSGFQHRLIRVYGLRFRIYGWGTLTEGPHKAYMRKQTI